MTGRLRRFVAWVNQDEPVIGLALFRIAVGLVLLKVLVGIWARGMDASLYADPAHGGFTDLPDHWRFAPFGGPTPLAVDLAFGVGIASCVLVVLGLGTNGAAFLAGQCFLALCALRGDSGGGHDKLLTHAMWILALSPAGRSFSVWCRGVSPVPGPAWPRAVLVLQLGLTYTFAGIGKGGSEWWPWGGYDAVYRSLLQPHWNEIDTTFVADVYPLTQLATAVTMAFEIGFFVVPGWLLLRGRWPALRRWDPRIPFLLCGLAMHGTLELFMDLGPFALVTVAFYVLLFDADEYRAAWARLRGGDARAVTG